MSEAQTWMWAAAGLGLAFGAGLAWVLAVLRWNRLDRRYRHQLAKAEQARLFAVQQSDQARRQIELLQRDVGELRHQLARHRAAAALESPQSPAPTDDDLLLHVSQISESAMPPDGFAQTQVFLPTHR